MWSKERHQRILAVMTSSRQVSANELADLLDVSRETVRRDLLQLERAGQLKRVHGGAVLPPDEGEAPFAMRKTTQARAKQDIARKAVSLIPAKASILVDAGTTTSAFGQALAKLSGIMVVTNSIDVAQTITAAGADIELILLGGQITSDVPATYGELTLSEIGRFHTDLAVISPVAVSAAKGAFSYALTEAEIARAMIGQATQSMVLCDASKLGDTSRIRICDSERIDMIVADNQAGAEQLAPFRDIGVDIIQ